MWFMRNNCPANSDGVNTTSSFLTNAITTTAVTTTTSKVQSLPREMHENWNNTNVNWLRMSQALEETDLNNTTNFPGHIGVVE